MAAARRNSKATTKAAEELLFRFNLDGETYEVDPDAISWGEAEDVEDALGLPLDAIEQGSAKNTMAMIFLAIRRKRPDFDIAELRAMPVVKIAESVTTRPTESEADTAGSQP